MCEPLPRTINGGSPPTARNARTGEFTPPGIMLSARCCRRRDCSTLRDVMEGIEFLVEKFSGQWCCCLTVLARRHPQHSRSSGGAKDLACITIGSKATAYYSSAPAYKLI